MGTYSFYLTSRNNAKDCKINWAAMDKNKIFKSYVLQNSYESTTTLEEVAKNFDESKLFGYMTQEFIEALIEFNKNLVPYGCHPKIYYDYEGSNDLVGLEFIPGTEYINIINCSYNHLLQYATDDEYDGIVKSLPDSSGWHSKRLI